MSTFLLLVTSLENAVRRLQDALRDARDESTELRNENLRLVSLLESAGIDHRRLSGSSAASDLLKPPSNSSLHGSPSHGPDFVLQYATAGLGLPPSGLPHEQQPGSQQQPSINSTYSPFFTPNQSLPPNEFITSQNVNNPVPSQHTRGLSIESQPPQANSPGQFDSYGIPRPGSAASGTSSHSSTHSFHGAFDNSADAEPSMSTSKSAPALQLGFNELNIYGGGGASSAPGMSGGAGSSVNWNASFDPSSSQQQQQQRSGTEEEQAEGETDLGRSDTVKASGLHRRAHSHLDMAGAAASQQQRQSLGNVTVPSSIPMDHASLSQPPPNSQSLQPSQSDIFNTLGGASDDFDPYGLPIQQRHSRPGSTASLGSLLSNEGDTGHPLGHYNLPPQQQQQQMHHHQQHLSGDLDDGAYYSSEGDFNDFDNLDYMEGMEGADGLALVDSLGLPGGGGGFDMSSSPYGYGTSPGGSPGFPGMMPPAGLGYGGPLGGRSSMGSTSGFSLDPSLPPSMQAPLGVQGGMGGMPGAPGIGGVGGPGGGPGGPGGSAQVPMSSTLAVIKAQAFGTSRKVRTRAKRPGADSAAKVAMEALQARAQGLGLDVDLSVEGAEGSGAGGEGGLRRGGASVSRSGATLKRRTKVEDASPGPS